MSDLREAIASAAYENGRAISPDQADALLAVFEAYLREHDAQSQATGVKIVNDVIAANVLAERERIRQRIEALPGVITGMEYVHGVREGNSAIVMRADVLEALGGSDE